MTAAPSGSRPADVGRHAVSRDRRVPTASDLDARARGSEPAPGSARASGGENADRLRRRLWSDHGALKALRSLGLRDQTIRRFRLGMKEPYLSRTTGLVTERALAFPVHSPDGAGQARWAFLPLEGVTVNPLHPAGWSAGPVRACHSRPVTRGSTLLVVPTPVDMWLVAQMLGDAYVGIVVACPCRPAGLPIEWTDAGYWRLWDRVVLGLSSRLDDEQLAASIARAGPQELFRTAPPGEDTWADLVVQGGSAHEIRALVRDAPRWALVLRADDEPDRDGVLVGEFGSEPVEIEGAFIGGRLHHVVTLERRAFDERCGGGRLVQRYVVRVLRSDGRLLDVEALPAPPGTPHSARVLALSDGTRIASMPVATRFGSWRHASTRAFIEARARGEEPARRPLARIVADVEEHLRAAVDLPEPDDYATVALFVVASYVHRLFDALPILLVNGPRGSGKSELGQAVASASMNGLLVGRTTAAGLVRLLAESRGTVVLDDLERVGAGRGGTDDVSQILKVSYKRATARRITPGRDGRVEVQDFFSPKVVTNIAGCDEVLLSRTIVVTTRPARGGIDHERCPVDLAALRDEAHVWAMCEAAQVEAAYRPLAASARSRADEIAAPLRAMAATAGEARLAARLERSLSRIEVKVAEPVMSLVGRAVDRLVNEEGATALALPRLLMEMAVLGDGGPLPSPESLGRLLLAVGARRSDDRVERRRLHGEPVRVHHLAADFLGERAAARAVREADPFAFCTGASCPTCRYVGVCPQVAPGLRSRKERGRDTPA